MRSFSKIVNATKIEWEHMWVNRCLKDISRLFSVNGISWRNLYHYSAILNRCSVIRVRLKLAGRMISKKWMNLLLRLLRFISDFKIFRSGFMSKSETVLSIRLAEAINPEVFKWIHDLVMDDRKMMVSKIFKAVTSRVNDYIIYFSQTFQHEKLSARWVPRMPTVKQNEIVWRVARMVCSCFNEIRRTFVVSSLEKKATLVKVMATVFFGLVKE